MKKVFILVLIAGAFIAGNKISLDDVVRYIKSENDRIQRVEYCNDFFKGRSELLNKCLLDR